MEERLISETMVLLTACAGSQAVQPFDTGMLSQLASARSATAHKGDFGHALLVAGSYGMAGASVLTARSCMRCGIGLLTVCTPACNNTVLQISVPSAMTIPDPCQTHITAVPSLEKYSAIGIGPGLGKHNDTVRALALAMKQYGRPMVIDADAINIIAMNQILTELIPQGSILTPHIGEMRRLTGCNGGWTELAESAIKFAACHKCTVVMKGAPTITISMEGNITVNTTGNPGMATAGSGDVLTGIITSLLAQGYSPYQAAQCGVYIHGLAGDIAARELTETAMNSSDIADMLPKAWKTILHK